ncbi:hypothetical protein CRUP_038802 [Coryphaenoides rupestris]|nr:hypothetical protein CRUP_038802 [Coryphaenoides rupestris]
MMFRLLVTLLKPPSPRCSAVFLCVLYTWSVSVCESCRVSPGASRVWGPGLEPGVVLPVRYFFIQAVTSTGETFTSSPGKEAFRVKVSPLDPREHVRIHVPAPLDRADGSFLVRYRLYGTALTGLSIQTDVSTWEDVMRCPAMEPQIETDFASFPSIDLGYMLQEVPRRFSSRGGLIHYAVLGNRVYRRSLGKYTDFKMFSDEILLSLARKVRLPDVEFYINVGDWPMERRAADASPGPVPILSWCGSTDTRDIVLPTYDVTHSTLETMRGVTNDLLSIQGHTGEPLDAHGREERLQLAALSKRHPELLDAGITGWFFFRDREQEYKYQVNVDGTVAAYRFPYLMLGDSLVLKQSSPYYEHFYGELQAGTHYLPVQRDLSDLLEKIRWAKSNDDRAQAVAREGQAKVRELLQPNRLYCYYYRVLEVYAARQSSRPTLHPDMEPVAQPDDATAACRCERKEKMTVVDENEPTMAKEEL